MTRIAGDTADLPAGWTVDRDNWGARPVRPADQARMGKRDVLTRCCVENGKVCVMDAQTARRIDGLES